jgi:hypothetical protein
MLNENERIMKNIIINSNLQCCHLGRQIYKHHYVCLRVLLFMLEIFLFGVQMLCK